MTKRIEEISERILSYLSKYPDAGDTPEGITKWWLKFEHIDYSVDEVMLALESLMRKGLIRMQKANGGTVFYKMKKEL